MTDTPTDQAAQNFIQAMRRVAIARLCEDRDDRGVLGQMTDHGNLTCTATRAPDSADGVPLYTTQFAINGKDISLTEAEQIAMGEPLDTPSHIR
uniref:hypothetical protein n=1 Tax=Roseovarius sp. BRH_c41 TaxID=1629709 RepID=UPI000AA7B50A|nr:hypothetical protein [Roseovarius sp. BRH_c41]